MFGDSQEKFKKYNFSFIFSTLFLIDKKDFCTSTDKNSDLFLKTLVQKLQNYTLY